MSSSIKFTHNWNSKLNNTLFTTIRKASADKIQHYKANLGRDFNVILNDDVRGVARLLTIDVRHFFDLPYHLLALDTGEHDEVKIRQIFQQFGIGPEDEVLVLMFRRMM